MRVHSIFSSINGEVNGTMQGSLCTFIRLAGCNLRCAYCDTVHAQDPHCGTHMTLEEIIEVVEGLGNKNITITGGEPLLQKDEIKKLLFEFEVFYDYCISIETNGSIPIPDWMIDSWVVDWKGPSSAMREKMDLANFEALGEKDFVKFVIADFDDFIDALSVVESLSESGCYFAFSPSYGRLDPIILASWMQKSPVLKEQGAILNLQLHKLLNLQEG